MPFDLDHAVHGRRPVDDRHQVPLLLALPEEERPRARADRARLQRELPRLTKVEIVALLQALQPERPVLVGRKLKDRTHLLIRVENTIMAYWYPEEPRNLPPLPPAHAPRCAHAPDHGRPLAWRDDVWVIIEGQRHRARDVGGSVKITVQSILAAAA